MHILLDLWPLLNLGNCPHPDAVSLITEGLFVALNLKHLFIILLSHCRLNECAHTICWKIRYVRQCDLRYSNRKMVELFANSGYSDQMPHSAASDLGLHCLPITLLGVSRLQLINKHLLHILDGLWCILNLTLVLLNKLISHAYF